MKKLAANHTYEYLKASYFIRFLGDAFFYTFLYVYLKHLGLTTPELGIISAIAPASAFIGSIVFQRIAKNLDVNRIFMVIFNILEMSVALIVAIVGKQDFLFYAIIIGLVSLLNGPFYALLDGYSGTYISKRNKQYSSMRIMGTISYVIGPLVGGLLVEFVAPDIGYPVLFYASALFLGLAAIFMYFLPKQDVDENGDVPEEAKKRIKILKHPHLIAYLIFNFFVIGLSIVSDSFFGVYLSDIRGVSTADYGYLVSATIFVETLVFIFIIFRKNMFQNPTFSYILMGLLILTRPITVAFNMPLPWLFAISLIRGAAWGYFLVFNVKFLARIIPLKYLTQALFMVAIASTLGRIIGGLSIGKILESISYDVVFMYIGITIIIGVLLSVIVSEYAKRQEKRATEAALSVTEQSDVS